MMRILIDARMLLGRFSGVPRFVTRLIDELVDIDGIQVVALCGDEPVSAWSDRSDIETLPTDFTRRDRTPRRRLRWETQRLDHWIALARTDVYHATWSSGVPDGCPTPTVLTIHDLIPWHNESDHFSSWLDARGYRRSVTRSARSAARITTVSEFVRCDVIETLHVDPSKVTTIYNGAEVRTPLVPDETAGNPKHPFLLYVGGLERRKNLETLFRAMAVYWAHHGDLAVRLTGDPSALEPNAAALLAGLNRSDLIQWVGHPNDAELSELYRTATALVLPSRAEGFGLPVVEAMQHGCPVVAARAGSLPEIVGETGLLVDPDDPAEFAHQIHRVITDEPLRNRLKETGQTRATMFRWRHTAQRMIEVYRLAAERAPEQEYKPSTVASTVIIADRAG